MLQQITHLRAFIIGSQQSCFTHRDDPRKQSALGRRGGRRYNRWHMALIAVVLGWIILPTFTLAHYNEPYATDAGTFSLATTSGQVVTSSLGELLSIAEDLHQEAAQQWCHAQLTEPFYPYEACEPGPSSCTDIPPTATSPSLHRMECLTDVSYTDDGIDGEVTLGGPSNYGHERLILGKCPPTGDSNGGNPCNAATGDKFQHDTDYVDPSGVLSVVRSYHSQLGSRIKRDSGIGYGWSLPFTTHSLVIDGPLILNHRRGGSLAVFKFLNGAWQADADSRLRLSQDATGYVLTLPKGGQEQYDLQGRLLSQTESNGNVTRYTYNAANQLETITSPFGHTLGLAYNAEGRVATVTLPNSSNIGYVYDNDHLTQVDYPDGSARRYHYEDTSTRFAHHLTGISIIDTAGTETPYATYGYDTTGKAILTEHAQTDHAVPQERVTFSYDSPTQTTLTDAADQPERLTFTYDPQHGVKLLLSRVHLSDNQGLHLRYDANNNVTCRQDAAGNVTTYTYNANNQRTGMTEGQGGTCAAPTATPETRTTTYEYVSPDLDLVRFVRRPSVATGQTAVTETRYGNTTAGDVCHGQPAQLPCQIIQSGFRPDGSAISRTFTMQYNASGQVISINGPLTPANGQPDDILTLDYYVCTTGGACGQLKSVTNALDHRTTYDAYYPDGRLQQMTDANGLVTTTVYDNRGRIDTVTQTPPAGDTTPARVTRSTYTAFGAIDTLTTPGGTVLTYGYDAAQDLGSITDNLGNKIEYDYDSRGNQTVTRTKDPDGTLVRTIELSHDARNHVASINAAGSLTTLINDAVGSLLSTIDPNNNADGSLDQTTHTPDPLNRLVKTVDLINGITDYTYDVHDNLTQVKAPNGATTDYDYDDLENVLQETSPDRGITNYTHDAAGNVLTRTEATQLTHRYTYDALGRLLSEDHNNDGSAEVTYTYDSCTNGIGKLCDVSDTGGSSHYAYNAHGNLIQHQRAPTGQLLRTIDYSYDKADRLTTLTYPDGRTLTYHRNVIGQLTQLDHTKDSITTVLLSTITYDGAGARTGATYGNGLTSTRDYDLKGQVTQLRIGSNEIRDYSLYDANGNLKTLSATAYAGNYGYDLLDRLTGDKAAAHDYDANGNRRDQNTITYQPNSNRIDTVNGTAISYDAAGRIKTDHRGHRYVYHDSGRIYFFIGTQNSAAYWYDYRGLRTRKSSNAITTTYYYDPAGHLLQETDSAGNPKVTYIWADGQAIAQITHTASGETITYLHTDHLNTPRVGTDDTGTVTWRWEGEAFGLTAPNEDPDNDGVTTTVNLRFPGQYYDAESGLHYNWNRYYDPELGRYITSDPIGLDGGLNTYAYANSNPVYYTDPTGEAVAGLAGPAVRGGSTALGTGIALGAICLTNAEDCAKAVDLVCEDIASALRSNRVTLTGTLTRAQNCTSGGGGAAGGRGGTTGNGTSGGGNGASGGGDGGCDDDCPSCKLIDGTTVSVGTIAYRPLESPDTPQHGIEGAHYNIYKANQNPNNCQCFWQPQGAVSPEQLPPGAIPIQSFAN